jgi:hypothetical protein
MATLVQDSPSVVAPKRLNFFERYLTLWVALCMAAGLVIGRWAPGMVRASRAQYEVKASTSDADAVRVVGAGVYELRHYTGVTVEYEIGSVAPFRDKLAEITFDTAPQSAWPVGAQLRFLHRVRKSRVQCIIGVLLGVIGAAGLIIGGSELWKHDVLNGLWILLSATASGSLSVYLLTGKLQFKSS